MEINDFPRAAILQRKGASHRVSDGRGLPPEGLLRIRLNKESWTNKNLGEWLTLTSNNPGRWAVLEDSPPRRRNTLIQKPGQVGLKLVLEDSPPRRRNTLILKPSA